MQMEKYKHIRNFISEKHFQEENQFENTALYDIGKTYLMLLTKKIIYFQFRKEEKRCQYIASNIDKFIIVEIDISNQLQLGMSVGKAFMQKNYDVLDKIQPEIKECIRSSLLKSSKQKNQNGSINQITRAQSTRSRIDLADNNNSFVSIKGQKYKNEQQYSKIMPKKILNLNDSKDDLFQLHKLIETIQNKKSNLTTDELTDRFLAKIQNGNTALNHFLQNFEFSKPYIVPEVKDPLFKVTMKVQFTHHWTDDQKVSFDHQATDKSKKKATQRCAKQILSQIFKQYPLLFRDFAAVVKKKGLKL